MISVWHLVWRAQDGEGGVTPLHADKLDRRLLAGAMGDEVRDVLQVDEEVLAVGIDEGDEFVSST